MNRREWLTWNATGLASLNLGGLWAAQAAARAVNPNGLAQSASRNPIRACILVFYWGGPSHLDTFDMKPQGSADVRGEFRPISTRVPGLQICEHLPELAKVMHHVAVIRSMHHEFRLHDSASTQVLTGYPPPNGDVENFTPLPQFHPSLGSLVAHLRDGRQAEVDVATLPFKIHNVVDVPCQGGGFLGSQLDPLVISADPLELRYQAEMLQKPESLTEERIDERRRLLEALESRAGHPELLASRQQWQRFQTRAVELLRSEALRKALEIDRETPALRERYGMYGDPLVGGGVGAENAAWKNLRGQNLLMARRLVEAGVPFVNVNDFRQQGANWDAHIDNFGQHKKVLLPPADRALASLIQDLEERGLLESTLVIAMGEFGRTPKVNPQGGRDHWPDCYSVLLAGGGVQGGAIYGASDSNGAFPSESPVTPGDLAATLFWRFGIDPQTVVRDPLNRPFPIATGKPLKTLFGAV